MAAWEQMAGDQAPVQFPDARLIFALLLQVLVKFVLYLDVCEQVMEV